MFIYLNGMMLFYSYKTKSWIRVLCFIQTATISMVVFYVLLRKTEGVNGMHGEFYLTGFFMMMTVINQSLVIGIWYVTAGWLCVSTVLMIVALNKTPNEDVKVYIYNLFVIITFGVIFSMYQIWKLIISNFIAH